MKHVGIIGWRGMVGSVLLDRMREEKDFEHVTPTFFSTSQVGVAAPDLGCAASAQDAKSAHAKVHDANDIAALAKLPMLISAQGGDYTEDIHPRLRAAGWQGYWIDAASTLRMRENAVIVLDPVNLPVMQSALDNGVKDFIGGNCTVSLMLMAVGGLLRAGAVDWITAMTYQSASGAGAKHMRELLEQMGALHRSAATLLHDPASGILDIDRAVSAALAGPEFPRTQFGLPLAASLIPWLDKDLRNGQSRDESEPRAEADKILGTGARPIPMEGICVRGSAMRCHSQGLTIKLKRDLPLPEIERLIARGDAGVRVAPNDRESSIRELSPAAVSGGLNIPIGRLRKLAMAGEYLSPFTVGDQLLLPPADPPPRTIPVL